MARVMTIFILGIAFKGTPWNTYWKGKLSTDDLLVLISLDQLLFILTILFTFFYKTSNINKEVSGTKDLPLS
jgi:hypothetical protein